MLRRAAWRAWGLGGIFLAVVYLSILDVAKVFSGGGTTKTPLDFFAAYALVVSLIFSDVIKSVLSSGVLILAQQPFDVGDELVIEELPGWRVFGVIQDFSLFYIRLKRSTCGELITLPLKNLTGSRFINLSRSDWKIECNFFTVDSSVPAELLSAITAAALAVIEGSPSDYDVSYGFLAVFHGWERPNKVVIRTFHRYRFNLSAAHKKIAKARHGIISAIRQTLDAAGIAFTELRLHATLPYGGLPYGPGATAAAGTAAAQAQAAQAAAAQAASEQAAVAQGYGPPQYGPAAGYSFVADGPPGYGKQPAAGGVMPAALYANAMYNTGGITGGWGGADPAGK
ncbi:hypothetical protein TSOC_005379 [Tetrabaena socialis]|uniref:Mechanosensitive ion channel MscS domain-containing protein n=1 Tax=Tetrabaena socialis TaxID=47790 RepID=A0A2J8A6F8_9CHLO|nr:hypothetical protein TSOC_005379 [Tetrabaena socialis]|eukprot:PNH08108.1 hypothetical protein TSOC_005379 [Tetrabaena socialis]